MIQPYRVPAPPPPVERLVVDDGEPMESARHRDQMCLLIETLRQAWQDRDFYVGGNMFFYYSSDQSKRRDFRGPDVFVVMNAPRRERLAWVTWEEEGQVPDLVIELLSGSTEAIDRGAKMRIYARLKIGEYFLFDPFSGVFEGYELNAHGEYARKFPDRNGRIQSVRLGLSLGKLPGTLGGTEAAWLRWFDETGAVLEARADAEERRADHEEHRADAERARADAERARADAERARADRLAAELEALKRR